MGESTKNRKPSSSVVSNVSSQSMGHNSNQSRFSISSIAVTDIDNDNAVISSPEATNKSNKSYFIEKTNKNNNVQQDTPRNIKPKKRKKRRQSTGASAHHLYPTPKGVTKQIIKPILNELPSKTPTLI